MARGKGGLNAESVKAVRKGYRFSGDEKGKADEKLIPDEEVTHFIRVTFLMDVEVIEWFRRRRYWERVTLTDDMAQAVKDYQAKINKAYDPIPAKGKAPKRVIV